MAIDNKRHAVGIFPTRQQAESALMELRDSHFPMQKVSVIARDAKHQDDVAGVDVKDKVGNKADEGLAAGATTGGVLGGIGGLLVGLGALAIPGVGPILLAGAGATTLATTLAGAGIGAAAGGLIGALVGAGIPEEKARVYNDHVSRGGYLVAVDGSDDEIHRAERILQHRGVQEWGVYEYPRDRTPDYPPAAGNPVPPTSYGDRVPNVYIDPELR